MDGLEKRFIPFGELSPDTIEFDQPELEVASNLTPSYGAYRAIESREQGAELSNTEPLRGGYCHLRSTPAPPIQMFLSDGVSMTGNFYTKGFELLDDAEVENYDAAATHGPDADDTTFIRSRWVVDPPSGEELRYSFQAPPRTPTTGTLGDVTLRVRLRFVGRDDQEQHRIDWTLYDANTPQTIATGTFQYDLTDEGWIEFDYDLSVAEQALITDWAQVEFWFTPESDNLLSDSPYETPDQDEDLSDWTDEAGGVVDVWDHINNRAGAFGPVPSYDEWAQTGQIGAGKQSTAIWRWEDLSEEVDPDSGGPTFFAEATANKENVSLRMQVIQPESGKDAESLDNTALASYAGQRWKILWETSIDNISTDQATPTPSTIDAMVADGYAWARSHDVSKSTYVAFTFTYGGADGSGTVYLVPDEEVSKGGGIVGAVGNVDNCVGGDESLASDGSYYEWPGVGFRRLALSLGAGPDRTSRGNHVIHVRARGENGGEGVNVRVRHDDNGSVDNEDFTLTDSFAWYTFTLRPGRVGTEISDYESLNVWFDSSGSNTGWIRISEVYFEYPGDSATGRLYNTYANTYPDRHMRMSFVSLDCVDPKNANVSDLNEIYVGTNDNIYEVATGSFIDVTRTASDYGVTGLADIARLWDFTSWGDDVIAVNYADVPQRRVSGATNFTDLITSSDVPRARFCAVVGAQLVLADINPTSYSDGRPYTLWSSYLLDPTQFAPADYDNLSSIFQLVAKPGAITGLVGGEYGIVFKRNSIWRMSFVGVHSIFQFDLIAEGIGCAYPQSIVSAGRDVYFWGPGGIYVLRDGYSVERISSGRVEKFLFDASYEPQGIYNTFGSDTRQNEALCWGAYDSHSGLVWWLYRSPSEPEFKLDHMVCYSTAENRFTTVDESGMDWTMILGRQNTVTNEPILNRGVLGFRYTDTETRFEKFIGEDTLTAQMKTKVITPTSWGYDMGRECEIQMVRPMYTSQTAQSVGQTDEPNFTITIDSAQDPAMRINADQRIVDRGRERRDGWIPVGNAISGEFFQFTVDVPALWKTQLKEFLGLQLVIRPAGDF